MKIETLDSGLVIDLLRGVSGTIALLLGRH